MPGPTVSGLYVYPLKSAGGIARDSVDVDIGGLRDDRRWMVVDEHGLFVSQRTRPEMALLRTQLTDDALVVTGPGVGSLRLDREKPDPAAWTHRRVWHSDRYSVDCGDAAAEWASDYLGMPCRVLEAVHPEEGDALAEDWRVQTSFADAFPALVISEASLEDLNGRIDEALPMNRFRPNIVVSGFEPYGEDRWAERLVGAVRTAGVKPCSRCATTLVDQRTGTKGIEPLRTLATYRRNADGEVDFGMNLRFLSAGLIRVGDTVEQVRRG